MTDWPGHRFDFFLTGRDQFSLPTFISARFFARNTITPVSTYLNLAAKKKVFDCLYIVPFLSFMFLLQNLVSIEPNIVITDSNKESGGRLTNHYTLSYSVTEIGPLFKSHTPVANVSIDVPFTDVSVSGIV